MQEVQTMEVQHYFAAAGVTPSSQDWTIYKGYFKGVASSGNGGQHNNITDPGTIEIKLLTLHLLL